MSMKKMAILTALAAMGMMENPAYGLRRNAPERKPQPCANERKKCFRTGCNNHRVGRLELYCSDECKRLYKEETKTFKII